MFGSVDYFTNCFKTCIMNNLIEKKLPLSAYHQKLLNEIVMQGGIREEKEVYLSNLERAYNEIDEELFGDWRKR